MKKSSKALASTAALCLVLSATPAFAAQKGLAPERLAGNNRIDTAIKIAEQSFKKDWKDSHKAILSAAADSNLVDSLAVAPLSYQLKAPILLNDAKDSINPETLKTLKANKVNMVYIATGTGVISDKAKAQLEKEGIKVERLGGKNRFETAKNILDAFKKNGGEAKNVALVSGSGLADALSIAPIAAKSGMPILLTNGKDAVAANLAEVAKAADKVYAIGGNGVISDALVQQLKADRLAGNSRYETNAAVIKRFANDKAFSKVYVGNGQESHLVDSLTGSVLAAQAGAPIVLANEELSDATKNTLKDKMNEKTTVVALGGEAVVSNNLVKDVVEMAKPEVIKVTSESVASLNETSVQVKGLAKNTKEADLKDKKIELKVGQVTLTAKYVALSLTEDGKANFVLENNKKLVDATEYTVESDWSDFVVNKFVAKVANQYIKSIDVTTKAIQGMNDNRVYFTAKNQYGENIVVDGNAREIKAQVKINGVPVKTGEVVLNNVNDGYITIHKELKVGDKVVIDFTNKINNKDVKIGTVSFTTVEHKDSVATTISDIKAEYAAAVNEHEANKEAKEVLPDDQVKLTVKINNQFGNPMAQGTQARWVVEAGKDLISKADDSAIDEVSDAADLTFKAKKAGDLKVSAYLANGKKVTYTVKIGAKQLSQLNVVEEGRVDLANIAGINHEEKIVGVVTANNGAILTKDMIKFDVKSNSKEVKASDIEVVAKLRGGDNEANKNDIVIAIKSSKCGKFVITPYVGESVEKSIKGTIITATTTIDQNVVSIDDVKFDTAELKVGTQIKKDIIFRNKYNEVVVLNDGQAEVKVTPDINDAANNAKVTKDNDKNKNVLTLKVDGAKTYNVVVKNGDIIRVFNLTFTNPTFTNVDLGKDITGVVAGDFEQNKAKYQEVKFLDQDEKVMSVKKKDIEVSVTKPDGQELKEEEIGNLLILGKTYTVNEAGVVNCQPADNNDKVVAVKVAPKANVTPGTYTIKVQSKDGKIVDTLNVTVGAKRVAKTVEVKGDATKAVLGGKVKVNIVSKDQYKEFLAVGIDKIEVIEGTNFTKGNVTAVNKDGKLVGYEIELTAKTKGTNDVIVNVKDGDKVIATNKVSMTVNSADKLIDAVEVDKKEIKSLYSTKDANKNVNLKAIVKDADKNIIPVPAHDLDWKVVSQKDKDGKSVSKTVTVDAKTGVVTAPKDTIGSALIEVTTANMKKANITLNFDNKDAVAQKGTVEVINTAKDAQDKILLLDADAKKEGIQISLDNDKKDGEKDGTVKVILNAKDQYGNVFGNENDQIKKDEIRVRFGDQSVVNAEAKDENHKTVITISAKGEGNSKVYVEYAGQTITLDVTANKEASDAAKALEVKTQAVKKLSDKITEANTAKNGATEGEVVGNNITGTKNTLEAAIIAATTVKDNAKSRVEQLNQATTTLDTALKTFNKAKVVAIDKLTDKQVTGTASNEENIVVLEDGETLEATSAATSIATVVVKDENKVNVTGVANGTTTINVKVKKDGKTIKVGTFTATVK